MAITINATPADSSANSYGSLEEANAYLEAHLEAATWAGLDEERQKAALVASTRYIDNFKFAGMRSTSEQSLAWPRTGVTDYDGFVISGVPAKLKAAQFELAIWKLTEENRLAGQFELDNLTSVEIGPIKYSVGDNLEKLPSFISDLLSAIGPSAVNTGSGSVPRFRW